MIDIERLKDLLSKTEYSRKDKILLCLAVDSNNPKQPKDVRNLAVSSGLRAAKKWNFSQILKTLLPLAINTNEGWELTTDGRKRVAEIAGPYASNPIQIVASNLRQFLPNFNSTETKAFIEESTECYESRHFRAAVVLSWSGAISLLHNYVVGNKLAEFNAEALRRDAKWKNAKSSDDLGRIKESDFLNIIEKLSVIGKNTKQELENCLKLRNGCGHPNSLKIAESRVASHLEILILNVFDKFS